MSSCDCLRYKSQTRWFSSQQEQLIANNTAVGPYTAHLRRVVYFSNGLTARIMNLDHVMCFLLLKLTTSDDWPLNR